MPTVVYDLHDTLEYFEYVPTSFVPRKSTSTYDLHLYLSTYFVARHYLVPRFAPSVDMKVTYIIAFFDIPF